MTRRARLASRKAMLGTRSPAEIRKESDNSHHFLAENVRRGEDGPLHIF